MPADLKIRMSGRIYYATIIIFAVLVSMVFNLVPVVLGGLIPFVWGLAALLCAIIYVFVRSYYIEFGKDEIHARTGLLNTKNLYTSYRNVDNVSVNAKLFERMVGLCEIRIDTAGRADAEIVMRHIPASQAREAMEIIKERRAIQRKEESNPDADKASKKK